VEIECIVEVAPARPKATRAKATRIRKRR